MNVFRNFGKSDFVTSVSFSVQIQTSASPKLLIQLFPSLGWSFIGLMSLKIVQGSEKLLIFVWIVENKILSLLHLCMSNFKHLLLWNYEVQNFHKYPIAKWFGLTKDCSCTSRTLNFDFFSEFLEYRTLSFCDFLLIHVYFNLKLWNAEFWNLTQRLMGLGCIEVLKMFDSSNNLPLSRLMIC